MGIEKGDKIGGRRRRKVREDGEGKFVCQSCTLMVCKGGRELRSV